MRRQKGGARSKKLHLRVENTQHTLALHFGGNFDVREQSEHRPELETASEWPLSGQQQRDKKQSQMPGGDVVSHVVSLFFLASGLCLWSL